MQIKRLCAVLLLGSMALVGMGALHSATPAPASLYDWPAWASQSVKRFLATSQTLETLAPRIMFAAGAKEQDGIFITPNYLLKNVQPPDEAVLEQNLQGIETFLQRHNLPATLMLIPTACAIKQQEVPARATLFNQKQLINDCYNRLAGSASTVDAYGALFAAKDQYTYYRTESNLTGLGGYYLYTALAQKLGFSTRGLDQFEVENLPQDFYGSLYQRSGYKGVSPDLLTLYRFARFSRQYRLSLQRDGETKCYYTLFPTHLAALGNPREVLMGGFGSRTDLSVVSPFEETMLIFADETVISYLPFLAVHYGNITVLDLQSCTPEQLAAIDLEEYDRFVFAYSVDNFIHSPVCAAAADL